MSGAAVLLMARAPRRGEVRRALEPLLGADTCARLHAALLSRASGWGRQIAREAVYVAHDPPDAARELRALLGPEVSLFPQSGAGIAARVQDAAARVFHHHQGPLLIAWPDLPGLRPEHASAAIGDLDAGCDVTFGPVIDGGFYLVGIGRALPRLFALPEQDWRSPDVMAIGLAAARDAGLEIGVLRAERGLHHPADVHAALADPLLAPDLERILRGGTATR